MSLFTRIRSARQPMARSLPLQLCGLCAHVRRFFRQLLVRLRGIETPIAASAEASDGGPCDATDESGVLLPFPIRGEALLVKLADLLRERIGLDDDVAAPFLLTMSRCPRPRLSIDTTAYVEYHVERATYCLSIDALPDSRLTLETTDFDTLVRFVVDYIIGHRLGTQQFEAVS
jgi:hypothetical protein